jgi:hypothetical protein
MGFQEISQNQKLPCPHGRIYWCEKCNAVVNPNTMPKSTKYISNVEIDVDNAWEDFRENCLEGIDNDFVLKLCRIAFISGMMNISHVNAGFAISMSEYLRVVARQNISSEENFEHEDEDEDEN